jgi:prepilin-type N-terminal cleavage/methylation domain-containing protein
MLQQIRNRKKSSKGLATAGFTIIEVMIVLAVAGIIMAIVFLAIPALQRSNRNTQRKSDASRVAGLVSEYATNNNGTLPTLAQLNSPTLSAGGTLTRPPDNTVPGTAPTNDQIFYIVNLKCGTTPAAAPTTAGASARSFVMYYGIEGSVTTQCLES